MRWRDGALVALLVVGTTACGSDQPRASACAPPPLRITDAPVGATNLVEPSPNGSVDTDGDGRPDEVVAPGLSIERADGTLRFPGAELRTSGDLDGDGRDDLVLHVGNDDVAVSGRTPPGTHDPHAVGVALTPHLVYIWPDDLDGRPGFDFAEPVRNHASSRTTIWSGAAVLALGPGGDARHLEPARTLRGLTRAVTALAPGARPETILLDPGNHTSLRFARRPRVVLRTDWDAERVEDIIVFDEGSHRRIALVVDRHVAVWAAPPRCR